MFSELIFPDIQDLIEKKDWKTVKSFFSDLFSQDIAKLLSVLNKKDIVILFRLIPLQKTTDVFSELEPSLQEFILTHFADKEIRDLINELPPDDRTALFEELPGKLTQKLINLLSKEDCKEALKLLGYPEDSVGRLMTPDYVAIRPDWSIEQAFEHIRNYGRDAETIDMIYVVDENWKLMDDIPVRRFVLVENNKNVKDVMDYSFIAIEANED